MASTVAGPGVDTATDARVAAALQSTLLELVDLSLIAKQAHWNVSGPLFRPLHHEFDEVADSARGWADDVAERLMAIGLSADGRAASVAGGSDLPSMPEGKLEGGEAVRLVADRMSAVAGRLRTRAGLVGETDLLSQDLLIEVGRGLEKDLWMLREQVRPPER